jgi:CGNR zinc finger protein
MVDIEAHDDTPAAPGRLELLQRFLNLHDHRPGVDADLAPPPEMVRSFLVRRRLLAPDAAYAGEDHARAMTLYDAIHARVRAEDLGREPGEHNRTIERAAERARFRVRFDGGPGLEPTADGVDGALGRLLVVLFLAELDGSWAHVKECASDTCHAVFFDRSKNQSGKWCSMQSCGNRYKVRAWRERHRSDVVEP